MGKILSADNISKTYGDKQVLKDISIILNEGELVSILGVSGVGKTTLFNVLSGLIEPDSGRVLLYSGMENEESVISGSAAVESGADGSNETGSNADEPDTNEYRSNEYRSNVYSTDITGKTGYLSYMLQKDLLLPHKTIIENAALPLLLNKVPKKKALAAANEYFKQFGIEGTQRKYPGELSGGMRQRVALLRTYLCDKRVALLDEPFSALDTLTRASMQQWYLDVMGNIKLSTLFITHDMDEAILLSDRIYIMKGSPAVIEDEIVIEESRPRTSEFTLSERFLEYKKRIRAKL